MSKGSYVVAESHECGGFANGAAELLHFMGIVINF